MMKTKTTCECEHEFTLVLTGIAELTERVEDALIGAGCDDATLSMRSGRPFLTFSRSSGSLKDAIFSAINAVRGAGIGADVLRVDVCNLVTQSDIARKLGVTRQLVHHYITGRRGPGGFPPPICEITEGSHLWMWCEVAYWLHQNDMIREDVLQDAKEVCIINNVLELQFQRALDPQLTEEVFQFIVGEAESAPCEAC